MIQHPKMKEWDDKMRALFDEIDSYLEDKYGDRYPLHPNRPPRDTTSNSEMDGLFNVGVSYTAGYGSEYGKGYAVDVYMSTLADVPSSVKEQIDEDVKRMIDELLPEYFPGRDLKVERDGNSLKIHGDLSLGDN